MIRILLFFIFTGFCFGLSAQNFTGQWKGQFQDRSTSFMGWGGDKCDYVLELESNGSKVTGFSYTYFNEGGKRYYTICKLTGFIKKNSKYVEVREVERTKTNVPTNIRNCFQIHKLTYFKQGNQETLEGTWIPAPDQEGDCGLGTTVLNKRILQTNKALFNNTTARVDKPKTPVTTRIIPKTKTATAPPTTKTNVITKPKITEATKDKQVVKTEPPAEKPFIPRKENNPPNEIHASGFEKRDNSLIKTIEVVNETFKVDLYDNGDIDGDTVSLFFNGKLVLAHKKLTDKALSLNLDIDPNVDVNELIMYAENLGSIPPNTAVMIVTDGNKRYEVRIASDLKKSGTIRFIHKPK